MIATLVQQNAKLQEQLEEQKIMLKRMLGVNDQKK